jgi:hypothetical protein
MECSIVDQRNEFSGKEWVLTIITTGVFKHFECLIHS